MVKNMINYAYSKTLGVLILIESKDFMQSIEPNEDGRLSLHEGPILPRKPQDQ